MTCPCPTFSFTRTGVMPNFSNVAAGPIPFFTSVLSPHITTADGHRETKETHRNHHQLRRMKRPHRNNNLLPRLHNMHPPRRLIYKSHPTRSRLLTSRRPIPIPTSLSLRLKLQTLHGRPMQNIQILPPLRLFPKGIPTRAPPEPRVEASCPLFDAGVVAGIEVFDNGDVGCSAGFDKCYV